MIEKHEAVSPPIVPSKKSELTPSPEIKFTKRIKHIAEYVAVRLIAGALSLLPRSRALVAGRYIGRLISRLMVSRSALARKNILASFPGIKKEEVNIIVNKCWENLGAGVGEFIKLPGMSKEEVFSFAKIEGIQHLQKSYKAGKGVLIVTAHYGAWELGAKVWPFSGFQTAVIARRTKNPWVNDLVTRIRSCEGMKVILSRDAVRESLRWLKQGNLLAVLIDHNVTEGGLKIPFFGRPAYTTSLPAILALRYGIPVHPVYCWREGDLAKIHIAPGLDFSDLTSNEADISEATLRMNAVVESWIRERPECWLWIHNRWKISDY